MRCFLLVWMLFLFGCGDDGPTICVPRTVESCVCDDGRGGAQTCNSEGSGFGVCECFEIDAGTDAPVCGPHNCAGCCRDDLCLSGAELDACGMGGFRCSTCNSTTQACTEGQCVCVPDCAGRVCGPDGCGGECGSGCPSGEVCDLGGTRCDPPTCTSCDDCSSTEACLRGECVDPWFMTYTVVPTTGRFPERTEAGDCWDLGCGLPDPSAAVVVDGGDPTTICDDDTLIPEWSAPATVILSPSSELAFTLYDNDGLTCSFTSNDPTCGFRWLAPGHPDFAPGGDLREVICDGGFGGELDALPGCRGMRFEFVIFPTF